MNNAKRYYELVKNYPYVAKPGGALLKESFVESILPKTFKDEFLGFPKWQIAGIFLAILLGFVIKSLSKFLVFLGKEGCCEIQFPVG